MKQIVDTAIVFCLVYLCLAPVFGVFFLFFVSCFTAPGFRLLCFKVCFVFVLGFISVFLSQLLWFYNSCLVRVVLYFFWFNALNLHNKPIKPNASFGLGICSSCLFSFLFIVLIK